VNSNHEITYIAAGGGELAKLIVSLGIYGKEFLFFCSIIFGRQMKGFNGMSGL
jgi:hypothetical protein